MPTYSKICTAPRPWAAILLGHGSFLEGGDQENYFIPDVAPFLEMRPSIHCQQHWPGGKSATGKEIAKHESIVFLVVCTGHACYDSRIVTEVGCTILDTRDRWFGGKYGTNKKCKTEGCMPLGDRGMNLVRLYDTCHFVVADTANHHNGTCANPRHTEKPYDFCYKKSKVIMRRDIDKTLELAFSNAAKKGLDAAAIKQGIRRPVILLTWGLDVPDAVGKTTWFKNVEYAEHWDISQHERVMKAFPRGISFADAIRTFGVPHEVAGYDVSQNCGNKSSFTMQLLWAIIFATGEQIDKIKRTNKVGGEHEELEPWGSPGVQSVLTRGNLPPGTTAPGPERIEYTQPKPPKVDQYVKATFAELYKTTNLEAKKKTAMSKNEPRKSHEGQKPQEPQNGRKTENRQKFQKNPNSHRSQKSAPRTPEKNRKKHVCTCGHADD